MLVHCPRCEVEIISLKGQALTCRTCKGALVPVATDNDKPTAVHSAPLPTSSVLESPSSLITKTIPPLSYAVPTTMAQLFGQGGSKFGHSAVSSYLTCPERARLVALRVRRKKGVIDQLWEQDGNPVELDALGYGTLIHAMMAIRIIYGTDACLQWMNSFPLAASTKLDAHNLIKTWDYEFPFPEPFETLGVEVEVYSDVGDGKGGSLLRTVRYDQLMRRQGPMGFELFAMEHKTMGSAVKSTGQYMSQIMTQVAVWNANPYLVGQHGKMVGVIVDALIKTKTPKADRIGPVFVTPLMEQRITEWLRLPEQISFPPAADGAYPRMLQSCYGKYSPCNYVDLCLHGEVNNFEQAPDPQIDPVAVAGD